MSGYTKISVNLSDEVLVALREQPASLLGLWEPRREAYHEQDDDLPLNQCTRIDRVLFDVDPPDNSLTVTLHDFFWPKGRDLVLREVPVPPMI